MHFVAVKKIRNSGLKFIHIYKAVSFGRPIHQGDTRTLALPEIRDMA